MKKLEWGALLQVQIKPVALSSRNKDHLRVDSIFLLKTRPRTPAHAEVENIIEDEIGVNSTPSDRTVIQLTVRNVATIFVFKASRYSPESYTNTVWTAAEIFKHALKNLPPDPTAVKIPVKRSSGETVLSSSNAIKTVKGWVEEADATMAGLIYSGA